MENDGTDNEKGDPMSATVILIEMAVFSAFFTAMVFSFVMGDSKNSPTTIHNYPPEIQDEYFKTHERIEISYRSKKVLFTKGLAVFVFTAILTACALIAGATTFKQGFWLAFGLMAWIGLYDTCFLDWVLFANLPIFRLEGTEHMDEAYHQKWFHVKGMLFPGIIFALIPAALVGWLVTLFR